MAKPGGSPAPKAPAGKAPARSPQQARKGDKGAPEAPAAKTRPKGTGDVPPRLKERFASAVRPALMKERGYDNVWEVPRLEKVVINMGVGEGRENAKVLDFEIGRAHV